MKDLVEIEGDAADMRCKVGFLAAFFLFFAIVFGIVSFVLNRVAMSEDPGESQQILIGGVAAFFGAFCGCSVLCGGAMYYHTRKNDNIYGGQVNVEDLPGSDCE